MDAALEFLDPLVFDQMYAYLVPARTSSVNNGSAHGALDYSGFASGLSDASASHGSAWARDNIVRQCISILIITQIGATALYWIFSALSYYLVFDRRLEYHPRFLKNQIRQEIISSMSAVPFINILTLPWFLGEVRGYSLLYDKVSDYGWSWMFISTVLFMIWNDFTIYWIHRLEHHPRVYKYIHKPHHKWIIPTPWAALAFHPLDGYVQSLPYHVFVFICPVQKYLYMVLFGLVQIWTILIHDGDMISGHWLEKYINSPAHHTLHHMYFTVNYGQYFTWADSYFNSHRPPQPELDPLHEALRVMREKGLVDEKGEPIPKNGKGAKGAKGAKDE
ncbi:C-5 sterol desaturase-like protein [Thermothelomyces thermophilus ATCC 42464]|uniref:C-5 sterol desaturase-like protein n=1 Tax=Thermothelomyces thermophilus (strain ATCC 42464 / BCRC 31852 / DSM 1799) TaxID=573729 RepID=G2QJ34_THET4|nr:C-5 sterol desaturase-like protein [Thermothelomyces thermophilus ATCC 42464]AEO59609.1 C-5 sterol desaturase-like protein [Thermothelomyces thermophilus ATCC 42464]